MLDRDWSFVADMDRNGIVTISDAWLWVKWLFFWPGDAMLYLLMNSAPGLAQFLELSYFDYHGFLAGVLSFITWTLLAAGLSALDQ